MWVILKVGKQRCFFRPLTRVKKVGLLIVSQNIISDSLIIDKNNVHFRQLILNYYKLIYS